MEEKRWLKTEEKSDRFHLLKEARRIEEERERKGERSVRVVKKNRRIRVDGDWFRWNRREERLEKIEDKKEEEQKE